MKSRIACSGIAMLLCLFGMTAATYGDSFTAESLFTIPYGSGPGQMGVWLPASAEQGLPAGPTAIAIGRDGSVYIADNVNKRIQRFSAAGQLLMEAKGPVDRRVEDVVAYERGQAAEIPSRMADLDNIQCLAVDSQDNVYVMFGAAIDLLAKFAIDGQPLWYMHMADAMPQEARQTYGPFLGGLSIGLDDKLCARVYGRSAEGVAIFDTDGHFLQAVNGHTRAPNGNIVGLEPSAIGSLALGIRMYEADGVELASFDVEPAATDPRLFAGASSVTVQWFDGTGHPYAFAGAARAQRIALSPELRISSDRVIVRCDASGRPLAGVRFPGAPFLTGRSVAIDRAGNIYRLAYGADSVEVIKYVLHTSTPEYSSLRED